MGTEIFKFDEEMTEKMKHEVANPLLKKRAKYCRILLQKKQECKFALTMND